MEKSSKKMLLWILFVTLVIGAGLYSYIRWMSPKDVTAPNEEKNQKVESITTPIQQ